MKLRELTFMCQEFYQHTKIPLIVVKEDRKLVFPELGNIDCTETQFDFLFNVRLDELHLTNSFEFMVGALRINIENKPYFLLIGPSAVLGSTAECFTFRKHSFSVKKWLTIEEEETFLNYCRSIYIAFNHHALIETNIKKHYLKTLFATKYTPLEIENQLHKRRSEEATQDAYQFELRFLEYIKTGQKEKMEWLFAKIGETYQVDLASNKLESARLKFTGLITLLTRQATQSGVPLDIAFSLSDALIIGIQKITNLNDCLKYFKYAAFQFMKLFQNDVSLHYSYLTKLIISYVDAHLYESIKIQELAAQIHQHPSYLSARFKHDTGRTLKNYILRKKIEEAKTLLLFTDNSYQDIATQLGFADQSHFIQVFKKASGITPKSFREAHFEYHD